MSVWDAFSGRRKQQPEPHGNDSMPAPSAGGFASSPFDPSVATTDVSSLIGAASLPDASKLHPLAGLNQQTLDYLSLDESALSDLPGSRSILPSRGWSDDLCYGTGVVYLTALTTGGTWGLIEGLNRTPASSKRPSSASQTRCAEKSPSRLYCPNEKDPSTSRHYATTPRPHSPDTKYRAGLSSVKTFHSDPPARF